ncbi:YIP1 family protein [Albimonas sp. CAU 1670]|uniref:YIP1 family protein n=1 Tax=Albimonas sp. CAU 1670 TaxID=3032599 RepID=UPI0023DA5CD6|nr:YIP1 family protein [Albimonas sp. CAU 1670]MDF2232556.1 YIP1 family protein [Albimonas sp. CAU 1670]
MAYIQSLPPQLDAEPEEDLGPATMSGRVLEAWADMQASTRRLVSENPSEGRLLFYLILSDLVFFLSWTIKGVLAPTSAAAAVMPLQMGGILLVGFLMRTAAMYVLAAAAFAACRVAGGRGSWRDTRAAVFWGALVSSPFGFLAAVIAVGMVRAETLWPALGDPMFALPPYYIGLVPFLWFIAAGLAAVHGMARVGWIFLILSTGTVALSVLGVYLSA